MTGPSGSEGGAPGRAGDVCEGRAWRRQRAKGPLQKRPAGAPRHLQPVEPVFEGCPELGVCVVQVRGRGVVSTYGRGGGAWVGCPVLTLPHLKRS